MGINPNYNIEVKDLYTTKDADVVAGDIIAGKVAYGSDGKIIGSLDLDNEKENSYNEGVADGYISGKAQGRIEGIEEGIVIQKDQLISIEITENGTYNREDGYNEVVVNVPDLNGSYDEGYSDGVVAGREEIITEQSDATITPQTVFKGEIGYGANNEKIVGEYEFVEGFNFSSIGYNQTESNECNNNITESIAYSKSLYDSIKPNSYGNLNLDFSANNNLLYAPYPRIAPITGLNFNNCKNLIYIPKYEIGNLISLSYAFNNCESLEEIPQIDTSNVTDFTGTFYGCKRLKNISLLDCGKVTTFTYASYNKVFRSCESLENLGGLKDLGKSFTTNQLYVYLTDSPKLTYSSLMNLINNLYDMTLNTSFKNTPTLYLHSSTKALLSDEDIAIATSKGWTIA